MQVTLHHIQHHTPYISTFWFQPQGRLRYTAGQFVNVQVPHQADARGQWRWFTLISRPADEHLGVTIAFPASGSSYKRALRQLQPGARLSISDPLGDFVLPKDPSVPLVWMAGGVGAAAFVGMAKEVAHGQPRTIQLLQSARQPQDLLFQEVWRTAGIPVQHTITGADTAWAGRRSRFTAQDILAVAKNPSAAMFYIAGSDSMVEQLCNHLQRAGIAREQLVREAFTGYATTP